MGKGLILVSLLLCTGTLPAGAQDGPVIKMVVPLPKLLPEDGEQPQSEMVCRPPQRMTESRNLGPRVCRPKAVWDELHAKGLDISADGRGYVASEKYRNLNICGQGTC